MSFYKLRYYVKTQFKRILIAKCILNSIQIAINIVTSLLFSQIVIEATDGNIRNVLIKTAEILSVVLVKVVVNSLFGIIIARKESLKNNNCKMAFYRAFFNKPLKDLYSLQLGETKEKINDDFNTVTQKYSVVFPNFLTVLLSAFAYLSYLLLMNKWIAITLLVISVIQIFPPMIIKKYLQINYDNCRKIEAQITDFIVEGYRGFLTIKLFKLKNWWQTKLAKYYKEYSKIGRKSIFTGTAEGMLDEIVSKILIYGTYGIIGLYVLKGFAPLSVGIQAIAISGSLYGAVKSSFSVIKDLAVSRIAENRLAEAFSNTDLSNGQISSGDIKITDMSYSFGDQTVFSGLNLSFDSAKITAIHGKNGGGKTTLLRLICGISECADGAITIDGVSPISLSDSNYPRKLFYLPQDDPIFNFSAIELFDMILSDKATDAVNISKRFGLDEQSVIVSKINELAGGERKKIFLSLGFAIDPTVMLLDEPTNSLDEEGKKVLKELLNARTGGAIIVTHDLFVDGISDIIVEVNNEKH